MPNVDVAVIELDAAGNPVAAANVLFSRDYPDGKVVTLDDEPRPERRRLACLGHRSVGRRLERRLAEGLAVVPGTDGDTFMVSVPGVDLQAARCGCTPCGWSTQGVDRPDTEFVYKRQKGRHVPRETGEEFTHRRPRG